MKKILSTMALLLLAVVALAACNNKNKAVAKINYELLRLIPLLPISPKILLEIKSLSTVLSRLVRTLTNMNLFLMM